MFTVTGTTAVGPQCSEPDVYGIRNTGQTMRAATLKEAGYLSVKETFLKDLRRRLRETDFSEGFETQIERNCLVYESIYLLKPCGMDCPPLFPPILRTHK